MCEWRRKSLILITVPLFFFFFAVFLFLCACSLKIAFCECFDEWRKKAMSSAYLVRRNGWSKNRVVLLYPRNFCLIWDDEFISFPKLRASSKRFSAAELRSNQRAHFFSQPEEERALSSWEPRQHSLVCAWNSPTAFWFYFFQQKETVLNYQTGVLLGWHLTSDLPTHKTPTSHPVNLQTFP